jgi:hypothetical protein
VLVMATCRKGNDRQIAMLAMATKGEGDDGNIARGCGDEDVGQVDGLRRECDNGQIVALAMATCS